MRCLITSMLLGDALALGFASANAGEPDASGRQLRQEKHDALAQLSGQGVARVGKRAKAKE